MRKLLQILILTALLATTLSTTPAMAGGSDPWPDVPSCIGCK